MSMHRRWPVARILRSHLWERLISLLSLIFLAGCAVPEAKMSMQKIGPQQSSVGEPAEYTITLNNVGDGSATDVVVRDTVPSTMRYVTSSPAGRYDPTKRAVIWELGTLEPGAGATLGVTLRGEAKGEQCNMARVDAARGVRGTARSCIVVAGLPDLRMEVRVSPNPVEVGFTTTYTVEVANQGSETAANLRITASIPNGMAYVTSSGPAPSRVAGNVVSFEPLPTLPPNATIPYRILARAQAPGTGRFEVRLGADHLSTPVSMGRGTRVTGDPAAPPASAGPPAAGLTHMAEKGRMGRLISVENILVRGRAVTGRVVNKSSRRIRDVYLTIRSIWLWDDEFKPGAEDPSLSVRFRVPGDVPAEGFLPFVYRPLPIPPRTDGHYETRVSIAEFSEVP